MDRYGIRLIFDKILKMLDREENWRFVGSGERLVI